MERAKVASDEELAEMGKEVASAMIKGSNADGPQPTDKVPLVALAYVADQHGVTELDDSDFEKVAKAMESELENAAHWEPI